MTFSESDLRFLSKASFVFCRRSDQTVKWGRFVEAQGQPRPQCPCACNAQGFDKGCGRRGPFSTMGGGASKKLPDERMLTLQYLVALREGDVEQIKTRLDSGVAVDEQISGGVTACFVVCEEGQDAALRLLCERGANVNLADEDGATPSFAASKMGHADVVRTLSEFGANLDTPNDLGETPCWAAAEAGNDRVLRALFALGADRNTAAKDGTTPLQMASTRNHKIIVEIFEEAERRKIAEAKEANDAADWDNETAEGCDFSETSNTDGTVILYMQPAAAQ